MAVSPGSLLGSYHIISPLGAGGMGEVFLAKHTQLGRQVAIKFPTVTSDKHHAHARFLREAKAVSALNHRNIATIYEYGETEDGQPYLVMEFIKGESLSDLMHSNALTLSRAVEVIADVADALGEAHRNGIIHRDIKPSNVMITERGDVKVLDFGLAKQLNEVVHSDVNQDADTLLATTTKSGMVVGTPLYLSPEQATGDLVDARSDIFALGSLLYECISGRSAFSGKSVIEITAQIIHVDPPLPSTINPGIPPELDRIAVKALAKAPKDRYQSTDEMLVELHEARILIDESLLNQTQRIPPAPKSAHPIALQTLSDLWKRPTLSIGRLIVVGILVGLAGFLVWHFFIRPKPYIPSAQAKELYDFGTNALHDGAYNQASTALQQAISVEPNFALAHARLAEALMELDYVDNAKDEQLRATTLASDRSRLTQLDSLYLDAITASVRRDFSPAIEAYQKIATLLPDDAHVYVDLGRAYENNGDIPKAVNSYLRASELGPNYATAYLRLGILYGRQQDANSARASFDKAEELYKARGNNEGQTEVNFQRGALAVALGQMNEARPPLQQALELAKALDNQPQQIKTMFQLVYVLQNDGASDAAQKLASEALSLAQAKGMQTLVARGLVDLGSIFFSARNYIEAERYIRQALEYSQRYKARRSEAKALFMFGNLRITQGQIEEGVRYEEQALDFYKQNGFRLEASRALTLLARANRSKGNYAAALQAFRDLLTLADEAKDDPQRALSHEGIASVLVRQGSYLEALDHFRENYTINKSLNSLQNVRNSLLNQAYVLGELGFYDDAREKLSEALPAAEQLKSENKSLFSEYLLTEAELALSERNFPEAKGKATESIKLLGEGLTSSLVEAKLVLGSAEALNGARREGKLLCEQALELAIKIGDPWVIARARGYLADALLEIGDATGALTNSLSAQEHFEQSGQLDWSWRMLLIVARASHRVNDVIKAREYAGSANDTLSRFQQKLNTEAFASYAKRPDVQNWQKQLREEFGSSN